jgi:hypothetical protein
VIALAAPSAGAEGVIRLAQVTIEQRVIIRVPVTPRKGKAASAADQVERPAPPVKYKEVRGPKCLLMRNLRGAIVEGERMLTLFSAPGERYRAHFGRSCRGADFYSGFYLVPSKDGSLCAGRDDLHARNGSTCEVQRFSRLVPDD